MNILYRGFRLKRSKISCISGDYRVGATCIYLWTLNFPKLQSCRCHSAGTVNKQCDIETGSCRCLEGFEGERCDRCAQGYYSFPLCRPCNCDPAGTLEDQGPDSIVQILAEF